MFGRRLCLLLLMTLICLNQAAFPSSTAAQSKAAQSTAGEASDGDAIKSLWTRQKGEDWPRFLGPRLDSSSSEKGINTDWRNKRPRMVWSKRLGVSYGIGVTSRGRFYQFDRFDNQATLYCLNAETGKELWRYQYPTNYDDTYGYDGGPRCSPLIDGNRVYAYGVEGMLICCHAGTGKLLWKVDTQKDFGVVQNFFGVGSNPIISGDLLIAMVGGSPKEDQTLPPGALDRVTGNGSGIVAFDKMTGKVRYQASDELASYASLTTAKVGERNIGLAFARGGLLGFDPANGKVAFNYPWRARILESVNASTPIVIGNQVLISETYGPGASLLDLSKGKADVVWADNPRERDKNLQTHWNTPIHHQGYVYGSSGRHKTNAELRCIRLKDGKVQWSVPDLTRSSLLKVDGHFVCMCEDGTVILIKIDHQQFKPVGVLILRDKEGRLLLKDPAWAAPILSHGLLYLRGKDQLVCLELIPQ